MKTALTTALSTNKGFSLFSLLSSSFDPVPPLGCKVHLLVSYCEGSGRGATSWERCGIKGACEGWSKVNQTNPYLGHSRSWLFHFAKVSAHLFRLCAGLSPLSGSMGRPAETRAHRGKQSCTRAWLTAAFLPFLTGTVPGQQAQLLQQSLPAAVPPCRTQHRQTSSCSQSPPTANKEQAIRVYTEVLNCLIMPVITCFFCLCHWWCFLVQWADVLMLRFLRKASWCGMSLETYSKCWLYHLLLPYFLFASGFFLSLLWQLSSHHLASGREQEKKSSNMSLVAG